MTYYFGFLTKEKVEVVYIICRKVKKRGLLLQFDSIFR